MKGPVRQGTDLRAFFRLLLHHVQHCLVECGFALAEARVGRLSPRWKGKIAIIKLWLGLYESERVLGEWDNRIDNA